MKDFVVNFSFAAPIYRERRHRRSGLSSSWIRMASSFGGKNGFGRSRELTLPTNDQSCPPGRSRRVGTSSSGAETLAGGEVEEEMQVVGVDNAISKRE